MKTMHAIELRVEIDHNQQKPADSFAIAENNSRPQSQGDCHV
jgi:hypothetical protein